MSATLDSPVASPYLLPPEAAQYIRQSRKMLRRLARTGELKPIRISDRKSIYRKADLDAFIDSRS